MTAPRFSRRSLKQLEHLEAYLAEQSGSAVAKVYVAWLIAFCRDIAAWPGSGRNRDDLLPGLRTRVFEKRRIVCFLVAGEQVYIVAIFGTAQNWEASLSETMCEIGPK